MSGAVRQLGMRRASLYANLKIGGHQDCCPTPEKEVTVFPFAQGSLIKQWSSMQNVTDGNQEKSNAPPQQNRYFLNINVGGTSFRIACKVAARYPITRIGKLAVYTDPMKKLQLCDDYSVQRNEYYFDRDPFVFYYIFHFYQSGVLWIMDELCPANFVEEIEYWGIHLQYSQRCCRILFEEKQSELKDYLKVQRELEAELEPADREEEFEGKCLGGFRKAVWNLIENPYSSIPAKIIAIMSSFFVLISIVSMTLSTVEEMQHKTGKACMEQLEAICAIFFTSEYLMRLISTSSFQKFLRAAFNAVDMLAILPFYIQILFEYLTEGDILYHEELHRMKSVSKLGKVLKLIKLLRIFRILKLARHSTGLRAFGFTIRQCYQQVCCLLLFIAMGVFTFSALMHSVEHDVPGTNFTSIPDAWWWAAVSLSTVGYGDTVPDTVLGRMVAFGCISFGIILNGMPISILYNKFSDYYAKLKAHENETSLSAKLGKKICFKERAMKKLAECCRADTHIHH
ncbi:PREDICTED: potassium voltage-gated channel subfamily V member 2-like [Gavialis gangeticus]|uniref:potassium voltage-gated channel subfamily V member 2-like n=1 Tax=Gavialis gangeticus TaxID=94835 RepID=UPI00092F8B6D|nr:PREDICTED: potassium voltage-gated channel subfamily V member 2-like [Gavialis gangeticus]